MLSILTLYLLFFNVSSLLAKFTLVLHFIDLVFRLASLCCFVAERKVALMVVDL